MVKTMSDSMKRLLMDFDGKKRKKSGDRFSRDFEKMINL